MYWCGSPAGRVVLQLLAICCCLCAGYRQTISTRSQLLSATPSAPLYSMTPRDLEVLMDHIESKVLPEKFGHSAFRQGQREIIQSVLSGRSCLAVLPTGAGKSLLYMLPSQLLDGITVVVSPLLALMRDQVEALRSQNIDAVRIDSSMTRDDVQESIKAIQSGNVRVLYVSPERFNNGGFKRLLAGTKVAMFVVDEAHCISEWGHAFRPDYLRLSYFAAATKAQVRLALTATATSRVARDILDKLDIPKDNCVRVPSLRSNIRLGVRRLDWPDDDYEPRLAALLDFLKGLPTLGAAGAAIVYVNRQRLAERLAADLVAQRFDAKAYHAGMDSNERQAVERWFLTKESRDSTQAAPQSQTQSQSILSAPIVVGTIAFGMGIDKSNIRAVVHFDLPRSVEDYVQGVGRAGRDGQQAYCLAILAQSDAPVLRSQIYGYTATREVLRKVVESVFLGREKGLGQSKGVGGSGLGAAGAKALSKKAASGSASYDGSRGSDAAALSISGLLSTADPSLYLNYYDLAHAFDVNELPLRLAMSHVVQMGVVSELTPVYGSFKVGMLDRTRLASYLDSLRSSRDAALSAMAPAYFGGGEDGYEVEENYEDEDDDDYEDDDYYAEGEGEGEGGGGENEPSSLLLSLCEQVSSHLNKEEATQRKKKWHTVDTIALGNALSLPPGRIVYALSLLCRQGICEDGGLARVYNRFRLMQPVNIERVATAVHQHAMDIQERGLARAEEIVALMVEGARPGSDVWRQIGTYFEGDEGEGATKKPGKKQAPLVVSEADATLPFDEAGWAAAEELVRSGAIPHDDPLLVARFATGVPSPRLVKLKLTRAEAFGCAGSCEWNDVLDRSEALCAEVGNKKK